MKYILTLILVFGLRIVLSQNVIEVRNSTPLEHKHKNAIITDTVLSLLLCSDTTLKAPHCNAFWIRTYVVKRGEAYWAIGNGIQKEKIIWNEEAIAYLDATKQPLRKSIIVWIVK